MLNPDPKKYVLRIRKGKFILVDKQILRWRRRNKRARKAQEAREARVSTPRIKNIFE